MARTLMARLPWLIRTHFESLRHFSDSSRKQILRKIFLFYYKILCCVYSLESPHRGDSNEYTQHTIILLKIENISKSYRHLLPDLAPWLNLIGSNYPSLEQISMVPQTFEPLKFDCYDKINATHEITEAQTKNHCNSRCHGMFGTSCLPSPSGLLFKEIICSLLEQILSYDRILIRMGLKR